MKTIKHIIARELMLAAVGGLCLFGLTGCESKQERQALYGAWCKLNNRHDVTIEEWQMLRENYMLPGGDAKRAVDAANSAAAMSAAAMGMSAASAGSK
jgi:hypothetical protein